MIPIIISLGLILLFYTPGYFRANDDNKWLIPLVIA
jgi:hypothetical protein